MTKRPIRTLSEHDADPAAVVPMLLRGEAAGAIPNGTRITKVDRDPDDPTPLGTAGTVLASHEVTDEMRAQLPPGTRHSAFFYFIEWDTRPGLPVGVADWKIA